jgi:hypothetical protein
MIVLIYLQVHGEYLLNYFKVSFFKVQVALSQS